MLLIKYKVLIRWKLYPFLKSWLSFFNFRQSASTRTLHSCSLANISLKIASSFSQFSKRSFHSLCSWFWRSLRYENIVYRTFYNWQSPAIKKYFSMGLTYTCFINYLMTYTCYLNFIIKVKLLSTTYAI